MLDVTQRQPERTARELVGRRHPDALAAFLGGSVVTARRTAHSDLDIVVLLAGDSAPYRESLRYDGWPVELFVHTRASWLDFVERETLRRRSPLLMLCAAGTLLLDRDGSGAELAADARRRAEAGPPPATEAELEDVRYGLTDLLDDLAGCADPGERLCVVMEIARRTGELLLLTHGGWLGGGKWLARRADQADPGFSARLEEAVRAALDGRTERLVALAEEVLGRAGGRFWEGYRRGGDGPSR
ncbi:nucleotidyltransferase domain-containing protein [Streptomyces sp. NPDC048604]|uniref:nucleotidyltransferase domain-containing protein n=1 Tax=Streptomyces sp. NPDC048604 TaxID=3365578 RepID=UPI0037111B37